MRKTLVLALSCVLLGGCLGQSRPARMQEVAGDFNVNTRFGRTELSVERVADSYRASFVERHKKWGGEIRISEADMGGVKLVGENDAEVSVRFGWWRADEGDLRVTVVRQTWRDKKGSWLLVSEERVDGHEGLFGEPPARTAPPPAHAAAPPKKPARFATVRIGARSEPPDEEIDESAPPTIPLPASTAP
jgi:hypothetical protein